MRKGDGSSDKRLRQQSQHRHGLKGQNFDKSAITEIQSDRMIVFDPFRPKLPVKKSLTPHVDRTPLSLKRNSLSHICHVF